MRCAAMIVLSGIALQRKPALAISMAPSKTALQYLYTYPCIGKVINGLTNDFQPITLKANAATCSSLRGAADQNQLKRRAYEKLRRLKLAPPP